MKKKRLLSPMYVVLALGYAFSGLTMLLLPSLWTPAFPIPYLPEGGPGAPAIHYFVRLFGMATLAISPLFLWCAKNLKKRKTVHLALTIYVVGVALVDVLQLLFGTGEPPYTAFWIAFVTLFVLPAVLMLIASMPALPSRPRGPREQGQVKWFNATKGFGFVTRAQGDDVFVHYRSIRGEGHRTLREGQQVEFVVVKGEKGLQAEDVQPL
jgi:cold shock CspA family protein